jgi:hypothetical protein
MEGSRRRRRGAVPVKKTHDYIHHYRGYWSDGGRCRIRIYREDGHAPVVICSQLEDNENTSVTNMAEYLAAEVIKDRSLPTPLTWIEHYPEHEGAVGEYSLVMFSAWEPVEACLGGVWRFRVGSPWWSPLNAGEVGMLTVGDGEATLRRSILPPDEGGFREPANRTLDS